MSAPDTEGGHFEIELNAEGDVLAHPTDPLNVGVYGVSMFTVMDACAKFFEKKDAAIYYRLTLPDSDEIDLHKTVVAAKRFQHKYDNYQHFDLPSHTYYSDRPRQTMRKDRFAQLLSQVNAEEANGAELAAAWDKAEDNGEDMFPLHQIVANKWWPWLPDAPREYALQQADCNLGIKVVSSILSTGNGRR